MAPKPEPSESSQGRVAVFEPEFREDLRCWVETDRKTALRVLALVEAVLRDPFTGIGKQVFPDAMTAALNLSTAMGQDLQSSVVQIGNFGFHRRTHCDNGCVFFVRQLGQSIQKWVVIKTIFGHVGHIHRWFHREQTQRFDDGQFFCVQTG